MNILSTLKTEASKLQNQLDTLNSAMKILGGKNGVSRGNRGQNPFAPRIQPLVILAEFLLQPGEHVVNHLRSL